MPEEMPPPLPPNPEIVGSIQEARRALPFPVLVPDGSLGGRVEHVSWLRPHEHLMRQLMLRYRDADSHLVNISEFPSGAPVLPEDAVEQSHDADSRWWTLPGARAVWGEIGDTLVVLNSEELTAHELRCLGTALTPAEEV